MAFEEPIAQGTGGGLCFIEPKDAIDMIVPTLAEERKDDLLDAAVSAWADMVPDEELETHYAKAVGELDAHDIDSLANWHHGVTGRNVVPSAEFLLKLFPALGDDRREALDLAARMRMKAPVYEETIDVDAALDIAFATLGEQGMMEVARFALTLYVAQHTGSIN